MPEAFPMESEPDIRPGPHGREMHVLVLTPFFPSQENEVNGCFVQEPLPSLAKMGVKTTVIGVRPIHYPAWHESASAPARWIRYFQVPGILGLSSAGRFLHARLLPLVRRIHRMQPIDVIHAHAALPCGHAASLLAQHLQIPFVVTVHGLDVFHTCYLKKASQWRRRRACAVYQQAACVICISGKVQTVLDDGCSGTRSIVLYNGTDTNLFSPANTAAQQPEILAVGNLTASKGQAAVIRAFARLRSSMPDLQCTIIGDGPDRQTLEALAGELGIRPHVQFLGRQSRQSVATAMRRCSVLALPSNNEGLGCVYLEAMACAKPVIACRGQGIEEIIEHQRNGWLLSATDATELEAALSTVLGSPDLALKIGVAARQTIEDELTLAHHARGLAEIYRQAILSA